MKHIILCMVVLIILSLPAVAYTTEITLKYDQVVVPQHNDRAINLELTDWTNSSSKYKLNDEYTGFLFTGESFTNTHGDKLIIDSFTPEYFETIISVNGLEPIKTNLWEGIFKEGESQEADTTEGTFEITADEILNEKALIRISTKPYELNVDEKKSMGNGLFLNLGQANNLTDEAIISISKTSYKKKNLYLGNVVKDFQKIITHKDETYTLKIEDVAEERVKIYLNQDLLSIENSTTVNKSGIEIKVGNIIKHRAIGEVRLIFSEKQNIEPLQDTKEIPEKKDNITPIIKEENTTKIKNNITINKTKNITLPTKEKKFCYNNSGCDDSNECTRDVCTYDGSKCDNIIIPNCEEKEQERKNVLSRVLSWFKGLFS